jgi:hypothetical protein
MEFDIRNNPAEKITVIRFADNSDDYYVASGILRNSHGGVEVIDIETERDLRVRSKEHAQNLIKALNKAIELGWFGG